MRGRYGRDWWTGLALGDIRNPIFAAIPPTELTLRRATAKRLLGRRGLSRVRRVRPLPVRCQP